MDVSGWTIEQKMRLPDWCFGQRQLYGTYSAANAGTPTKWEICDEALPDPACIWTFGFIQIKTALCNGQLRIGLAEAVPVNVGQMDAAVEILEHFGSPLAGPNLIVTTADEQMFIEVNMKRGLATGGKKFVTENRWVAGTSRFQAWITASGLPTGMSTWLSHNQ